VFDNTAYIATVFSGLVALRGAIISRLRQRAALVPPAKEWAQTHHWCPCCRGRTVAASELGRGERRISTAAAARRVVQRRGHAARRATYAVLRGLRGGRLCCGGGALPPRRSAPPAAPTGSSQRDRYGTGAAGRIEKQRAHPAQARPPRLTTWPVASPSILRAVPHCSRLVPTRAHNADYAPLAYAALT